MVSVIYIIISFLFSLHIEGNEHKSNIKDISGISMDGSQYKSSRSNNTEKSTMETIKLNASINNSPTIAVPRKDILDVQQYLLKNNSSKKQHSINNLEQMKRNDEFNALIKNKLKYHNDLPNNLIDVLSSTKDFHKIEPEIVSLKGFTGTFLEMLNRAHESDSLEDPFHLWSLYNNAKTSNMLSTDSSSFIEVPNFIEKKIISKTTTESSSLNSKSPKMITKQIFLDPTTEKNILKDSGDPYKFSGSNQTKAVPIYEEIRSALHIDTSIDDVIDDNFGQKNTENGDEFLPAFNVSRKNRLETEFTYEFSNNSKDYFNNLNNNSSNNTLQEKLNFGHFEAAHTQNISAGISKANYFSFFTFNNAGSKNETHNNILKSSDKHDSLILSAQAERIMEVMNTSVDPCDDFYEYACGRWADVYPLENKALDNTFDRLREGLDEVLKSLLETPFAAGDSKSSQLAKILYRGCMNAEQIESVGSEPLRIILHKLGGWPVLEGNSWNSTNYNWVEQMAELRTYNNDILLAEWVAADITNSSRHIIQFDQPDLGLPSREYFLSRRDKQYRDAYLTLMLNACKLLGADTAIAITDMVHVLDFEIELSKILTPSEERKNLSAVHCRMNIDQLQIELPEIPWKTYLSKVSGEYYDNIDEVIMFSKEYVKKLILLVQKSDKRTVSNYLLWRFVKNRINNLGREAVQAKQEFIQVLFGSKSQPERWISCVSYVNGNLGHTVGSMFVQEYYPKSSKNDSEEIIRLIRESFADVLATSEWLEKKTRQIAVEKVEAMVRNVGYPEHILNSTHMDIIYSELEFNEKEHFWNVIEMLQFHAKSTHKLLGRAVNREEWTTTPAVVNAYYSRSKNMIMFPAGLLQPPFYHPAFPKCLNFGGVGVVIGHEISHGFDDRGRQFDLNGNLHQWWTANDVENFYKRATCMLIQYGDYTVKSVNMNINSVNTLSENIADNIGVKISYKAYQKWKDSYKDENVKLTVGHLTNDQLFFLNFGQIWCEINSPEAILTKLRGGQHSPNRFRVIGTLSNSPEFSAVFNCPKGSPMNPEEKCAVW